MREKPRKLQDTFQNSDLNESLVLHGKWEKSIPLAGPHLARHSLPCSWKHAYREGPFHPTEHGKLDTVPKMFEDSQRAYALIVSPVLNPCPRLPFYRYTFFLSSSASPHGATASLLLAKASQHKAVILADFYERSVTKKGQYSKCNNRNELAIQY